MNFIAPLMILGLAGAAVPIVIHLIGRRRAPSRKLATIDFLLGTNRRVARRLRLRELLLLALRVLSCMAIPLALSKPFVSCATQGVTVERGPQAVVLILDDSFTMGYRKDGETLFDRARDRAARVLEQLGPEAEVALEHTAEGDEPAGELSRDHVRLRDGLAAAKLTARPAQTGEALRRASALLATSPHETKKIYLFSTLAATGFRTGEPTWEGGAELVIVPLDQGAMPNLAMISATAEKEPDLGPRGVAVTAKVQSFGGATAKDQGVTLRIGGKAVARGLITIGPGETAQKRFTAVLPPDARAASVSVELDGDALGTDDRRYLRVELRKDVRVLLVDGDPRSVRHDDELFYLETALRPGDRADSAVVVTTTTADELPRRKLSDYDVIFLCNVKPLDPHQVEELAVWVEDGGGLAITLGDNVQPEAYNLAMSRLLARPLRSMRQLAGGPKGVAEDSARLERLGRFESSHPIFSVFTSRAAGLREASFWKIFLLEQGEGAAATTLAHFTGGAPALVEAHRGDGRLLLWASTIDRDWNDLAIHPGFLPLMQQMARHLARAPVEERETEQVVGRGRLLPVSEGDQRLEVTSPSGQRTTFEAAKLKGRTELTFTGVAEPGFYEVVAESEPGTRRAAATFVANVDPRGSDTAQIAAADLNAPGAAARSGPPRQPQRRVELWHGLAAALLLFLLGEAALTWRG